MDSSDTPNCSGWLAVKEVAQAEKHHFDAKGEYEAAWRRI